MNISSPMGWVTLNGEYINIQCPAMHGSSIAGHFPEAKDPQLEAELAGWLRLSSPDIEYQGSIIAMCMKPLTQLQQNTLLDWCSRFDERYDEFVKKHKLVMGN